MATINGTASTYWTFKLEVKENSTNIENNTSSVTVAAYIGRGTTAGGSYMYGAKISCTVGVTGCKNQTISYNNPGTVNIAAGGWLHIGSTTFSAVPHNDDGTKVVVVSASFTNNISPSSGSASGSVTLTTIARASQPSLITYPESTHYVGYFGDTIAVHMNRKSSSFTHTVRYEFGDLSGTCINADTGKAATGIENGFKWKIPESFMHELPAAESGSGRIYVDTYNGSTKIGTKYSGFSATVPLSVKPAVSITWEDVTGIDDIYGSPVKGLSKIKVTVNATPAYSSPIDFCDISIGNLNYSGKEATSGFLPSAGKITILGAATDKRTHFNDDSDTVTVLDYAPPAVTKLTAIRCNKDGTANKRGAYIKATFSAAVSSMNSKNTATYSIKYKKTSDADWETIATDANGKKLSSLNNSYSPTNQSFIFEANAGNSYDVIVSAVDRHNASNPATKSAKAPTAASIFSWRGFKNSSGNKEDGAGIGKVPEKPNCLQVGWKSEFEESVQAIGNSFSFQPSAFNGEKGYTLLAVITLNELNVNAPIVFKINRRGALSPMVVNVRFASSSTTTDPALGSITYEGTNYGAFLIKTNVSEWRLYVDNTGGWSNPCLQEWFTTDNQCARLTVSFLDEQLAGETTDVLKEAATDGKFYRATPAVLQSVLDCIFPVGFVLTLYSQADPNDMYPGTTWVRIENRFLWACDENGDIGTIGGEKTHTLTVAEMPEHGHGATYTGTTTEAKTHPWFTSGGSSMAYVANTAGGGQAHNNMPPYIQVAVWRRTA